MSEPVGLDDQATVAPEEIHLVWTDTGVHLWLGKAVAPAEADEHALQLAAGELVLLLEVR
jgi:hypothetical protein